MLRVINFSTVGHTINILSFIGVTVFAIIRQREFQRTTRYSSLLIYIIIVIGLVFASINLFRLIYEVSNFTETAMTAGADAIAQSSGILVQSVLVLVLFASKIVTTSKSNPACIVVIGAHPDDIEIAAGAALAKMRDSGYNISGLVLTHGAEGKDGNIRSSETLRGAKFLGLETIQVADFTETNLAADIGRITSSIEELLVRVGPDIIFTHSSHDIEQDHRAVHEATIRAARNTRTTILCFESPSVTLDFSPTYFIDVDKYVDVKIQSLREHWSQRKKPYMKPDLVRGKLAFRGAQAKVNYAEGFEVARMISAI